MNRDAYHAWKTSTPYTEDWRAPLTAPPRRTVKRALSDLMGRWWHRGIAH